tara:strand:- start:3 stop:176 length:174 start_codon:yes stop_codon:yes gene_type:complete
MNITKVKQLVDLLTGSKKILEVTIDDKIHYVPKVDGNAEYQEVIKWVAAGNTIEDAD